MYYLVNVDHEDMAVHLNSEGFQEVLYVQCSGWD